MKRFLRKILDAMIDAFKKIYVFFSKKRVSVVCAVLFTVLVGAYVVAHIFGGFSVKLNIAPATIASENIYEFYDAYVFRDENVIYPEYSGYRLDLVPSGAMVGIGTEYARVYKNAATPEFESQKAALDESIELMEAACILLNSSGIESAMKTLREGYRNISEHLADGNIAATREIFESVARAATVLEVNRGSGAAVEKNLEALRGEIQRLKSERDALIASLGTDYITLVAEKTGYYYSGVDGFESAASSLDIESRSFNELSGAIETFAGGEAVNGGEGRLVYDPHWYVALCVDMSVAVKYLNADGSAKNQKYELSFYGEEWKTLDMALLRVVASDEDERAILIFSSSVMDVGFSLSRLCRARIHTGQYEGYRVPLRALHQKDGKSGVYVLTYGTVEWRYVDEIYRGDSYILAKIYGAEETQSGRYLALNDSLIIEGEDLYDGKTVD